MRAKTSKWYECKASYDRVADDGKIVRVTDSIVVEAGSFSEAEGIVMENMAAYAENLEVVAMKICKFKTVCINDCPAGDWRFFSVKVEFITLDEKTGKERRTAETLLIESEDLDDAVDRVKEAIGTMADYKKAQVTETRISEIIEK